MCFQAKLVSEQFKALGPEEKKKYEDMAKKDKERYGEEMKNYSPPKGAKGSKKGGKKDKNAPKRAMTSFMLFSQENRERIKKENPGISFGEIGKKLGEEFKKLSPEERAKYDQKNEKDKERYKKEMAEYTAKKEAASDSDDDSDGDEDAKPAAKSKAKDDSDDGSDDDDDDDDSDDE